MAHIVLLGTCDTKLEELLYLRTEILRAESVQITLIDVGNEDTNHPDITISSKELRDRYGGESTKKASSRSEANSNMAQCATQAVKDLHAEGRIHGIIAAGGSGGTSLASAVMRNALPVGFPKLLVSTVASGDVSQYVEETDITMMYSVVDIAGLNQLLRSVLVSVQIAVVVNVTYSI